MAMETRAVAVVEWHWAGHHPMHFAHWIVALESQGVRVFGLCPSPDEAIRGIERVRVAHGVAPHADQPTVVKRFDLPSPRMRRVLRGSLNSIDLSIRHFTAIQSEIQSWEDETECRIDLVFYACIYDKDFQWFHYARPFLRKPWSGFYVHAQSFRMPGLPSPKTGEVPRPERIFNGPLCKSVVILDEGIAGQVASLTRRPVVVFPDLTLEELPASGVSVMLADRLLNWAAGRPVVGLFGFLQPSKGLIPLIKASLDPRLADVCFAFGGEIHWPLFSARDAQLICDTLANSENTWSHLMRIPEEAHLNSILASCDILYAAYVDFPHSSGIVTKAALLKKPLIVNDGYLMAERVRAYGMGEVVTPNNSEELVAAILKLTRCSTDPPSCSPPGWADYLKEHSFERLTQAFRMLVGSTTVNIVSGI